MKSPSQKAAEAKEKEEKEINETTSCKKCKNNWCNGKLTTATEKYTQLNKFPNQIKKSLKNWKKLHKENST